MLNDVHAPPLDADVNPNSPASEHAAATTRPARADRAHSLERTADHGMGTNLVFGDPEDRGNAFNTTMSAVIVGGVLVVLLLVAWSLWT